MVFQLYLSRTIVVTIQTEGKILLPPSLLELVLDVVITNTTVNFQHVNPKK